MSQPGFDPAIVSDASAAQSLAADPSASVFVEANAGSGKTRVLVDRVARLLLAGAKPDRILCVTFTKAAAGEMQTRLFRKLGDWSTLPDDALTAELDALVTEGQRPELAEARRLFARALETPGGLKIQTLHAFCERLLRRFPLEAGLPPGFDVQDDAAGKALQAEALDALSGLAHKDPEGEIAQAIAALIDNAGADALPKLASFAMSKRHEINQALAQAGSLDALLEQASALLGVDPELDVDQVLAEAWADTDVGALEAALSALQTGGTKTDQASAQALLEVLDVADEDAAEAFDYYIEFLTTKTGALKKPKSIFSKKTGENYRILVTLFGDEGAEIHRVGDEILPKLAAAAANRMTRAALRLAERLLSDYQARLNRLRRVDFSDLVERARLLLTDSEARGWALYKLDQGLDHVLVDEAQDTAPEQWSVINALTEEFFAGEGAHLDQHPDALQRTVFCVGDEKQSIYSFQNADPREFLAQRQRLQTEARLARLRFESPPLNVSFRSSPEILAAVDACFAAEAAALSAERKDMVEGLETKLLMSDPETLERRDPLAFHRYDGHLAARAGAPGCVEIWPAVPKPEGGQEDELDLRPVDAERKDSARNQLAEAVASEIADILKRGDGVWEEGKPWRLRPAHAGDIIVLVRRRGGLFEEIIRRLKLKDVPVAGADRMTLPDQLVVEDLLSLARFALLPEDDLSLAEVLKSPFFHPVDTPAPPIDDDALFDLSRKPGARLWDKLRQSEDPRFAEARSVLDKARARVETDAPYAFFARFLTEASPTGESRLARLYARLGEEARDPAEEFLNRALAHEVEGAPSLSRFVAELQTDDAQIKREMEAGRGEVRVMTVHGAKGLEAPIVFLPDTTQLPKDRSGGLFAHEEAGLLWAPDMKTPPPLMASMAERKELDADGEYQRLLYVAMTRARDRLIVCGHTHGVAGKVDAGSWYDRCQRNWTGEDWRPVRTTLDAVAEENGWTVSEGLRFGADPKPLAASAAPAPAPAALPEWATRPPPVDPAPVRSVAPSHLLGEEEDGFEPASLSPLATGGQSRFRRGELIHKLLQTLPDVELERREASALRYLETQTDLSESQRREIASETLRVISDPAFAALFQPGSRAEAAVAGQATGLPGGMVINGQIDRLVVTDHEVLIVDYKTNRPPPTQVADVPRAYLAQMAAYRALLQGLHPNKPVRCALLWTDAPRLMELPGDRLDAVLSRARRPANA
ncbi:MAG: double-strand break repair helicase AddA [Oceanicaulis sp.]|jgi:ATP-dependent helicase/nuclease subunit A|nr:double-strand break repair helicase AddA [Oceanicaulis sp.]